MLKPFTAKDIFPPKASVKPVIKGNKIPLITNHFPVAFNQSFKAVEWNFVVVLQSQLNAYVADPNSAPDALVAQDNRQQIDSVLMEFRRDIHRTFGPTFTNGASLYCFKSLPRKDVVLSGGRKHALVFKATPNNVSLDDLAPADKSRMKVLQLLNSQVKSIFKNMGFIELGFNKRYYDPKLNTVFEHDQARFTVMKGFGAVFEAYEAGLMLQLDYATRIVSAEDLWSKLQSEAGRMRIPLEKEGLQRLSRDIVEGRSFMTTYGNQKIVIVDGLDLGKTPLSAFPNPEYKNYKEYFDKRYGVIIKDANQPLVVRQAKRKQYDEAGNMSTVTQVEYYVPELLRAEGIPERLRQNFHFMQKVTQAAILNPEDRFRRTQDMVNTLNADKTKAVDFKLLGDKNKVEGVQLDAPKIFSEGSSSFVPGGDQLMLKSLAEHKDIANWVIVFDQPNGNHLDGMLKNLYKVAGGYKISLKEPRKITVTEKAKVDDVVNKAMKDGNKPELVLVFASRRTCGHLYKRLKQAFIGEGIITQFFASFNPDKDLGSLTKYRNLVHQIQAKLGCNLWLVENDLANTLVLGADVYHSRGNRSVAALVGQFGPKLQNTYTCNSMQSGAYEEIINSMASMFLEILEYYLKTEKKLPAKVLFYRDGVGQSFIERLLTAEISGIIAAMETKFALQRPKITVVMITKRISDKIATATSPAYNPPAGTVVDSGVVHPEHTSFLMINQKVTQGTANPTKYQVVYDENDTKLDALIRTTNRLCWGYFNWLGPVKVPAPVQYAHKSAFLLGEIQQAKVALSIRNKLHYL